MAFVYLGVHMGWEGGLTTIPPHSSYFQGEKGIHRTPKTSVKKKIGKVDTRNVNDVKKLKSFARPYIIFYYKFLMMINLPNIKVNF